MFVSAPDPTVERDPYDGLRDTSHILREPQAAERLVTARYSSEWGAPPVTRGLQEVSAAGAAQLAAIIRQHTGRIVDCIDIRRASITADAVSVQLAGGEFIDIRRPRSESV